ncbi:hypothetical protein WR25_17269 isoform B [Diploscapter pachys]|uniref:Mitochondrial fission factor n=1 Tax=Diploscapter pachys TaxID=2018661 RepID=A0A2A2L0I4_9BILA|nr:hypothetical protein WR25_17269 isoform B [Diploscapter pachys]
MTVPDRIVMDGGDRYKGFEASPREVIRMDNIFDGKTDADMMHVPQTLTVAETSSPDEAVKRPVSANEDVLSTSSIAIEENPLQQLKIMRRQLTTISQRLYDLEEEKDRQKSRNMVRIFEFMGLKGENNNSFELISSAAV